MEPDTCLSLWRAYRSASDPTAFDLLFEVLHVSLLRRLRAQFQSLSTEDLEDAVVEAFACLVQYPERYDPEQASLKGFLTMIATRRLIELTRRAGRRPVESLDAQDAEMTFSVADDDVESEALARVAFSGRDPQSQLRPEVQAWLEAILPDPRDQQMLLRMDERLTVEAFVSLYGLQSLPPDAQRTEMKRARDRISKRVKRDGAHLWNLIYGEPLPARFAATSHRQKP